MRHFLWSSTEHCVQRNPDNAGTQSKKRFPVRHSSCIFIPFKEKDEGAEVTDGIAPALLAQFQLIIILCIAPVR